MFISKFDLNMDLFIFLEVKTVRRCMCFQTFILAEKVRNWEILLLKDICRILDFQYPYNFGSKLLYTEDPLTLSVILLPQCQFTQRILWKRVEIIFMKIKVYPCSSVLFNPTTPTFAELIDDAPSIAKDTSLFQNWFVASSNYRSSKSKISNVKGCSLVAISVV